MFLIVSWISKDILMKKEDERWKKYALNYDLRCSCCWWGHAPKKKRTHNNWTLQPPQRTASFFSQSVLFDVYFCDSNNSVKGQHTKTSYLRHHHHHHHQHRQTQNVYNNLHPLERALLSTISNCIWFMWILHFLNDKQQQQKPKIYQEMKSTSNQNRTIAWIAEEGMGQKRDLVCIVKGII